MNFGDLLEAGNGVWAVLALWLTVFMVIHVIFVSKYYRITWRELFFNFNLDLSVQFAVGMLVVAVSILSTRAILWWARYRHDGSLDLLMPESWAYMLGTMLGIIGFLCVLRTVSQPVFGKWPWLGALASAVVYVSWWAFDKFT